VDVHQLDDRGGAAIGSKGVVGMEKEPLALMIRERVKKYGQKTALYYKDHATGQWTPISWSALGEQINAVAKALLEIGVEEGDRVGIFSQNRPEWAIVDYGIQSVRAVSVPLYATSSAKQVKAIVDEAEIGVLFLEAKEQLQRVKSIINTCWHVQRVIVFDKGIPFCGDERFLDFGEFVSLGRRSRQGEELEKRLSRGTANDLATIVYTSGTKGVPKGAMLTAGNFFWVLYDSENTEHEAANCSIPMTSQKPSTTPKKIGYGDFVQIFKIGSAEVDNWDNFEVRSNGVYVKNPESYKDCFLTPDELATLTAHPIGNLSEPALAFPCSKKELIRFIDFYGLAGFLNTEALKMAADGPEAVETEQETATQFAVSLPPVHQTVNFFTKGNGGIWHIGYDGKTEIFRHLVGFLYLAYLLERPGQDVHCTEIYQTEKPANSITSNKAIAEGLSLGSTSRIIVHGVDQEEPPTRESLKKHLDQLWADYYDAESDLERKEILAEITMVKQSLNAERTQHDLHSAKVQTYIKKGIDRAISALDKAGMNSLAEHLKLHINPNGKYGYIYTGTAWEITL